MNARALASIKFLAGPQSGMIIELSKPITRIGRDPGNDIVIADPAVSRYHARLIEHNGTWSIEKLAASNTLIINGLPIQQATINHNDIIRVGAETSFLFLAAAEGQRSVSSVPPSPALVGDQLLTFRPYTPTVIAEPLEDVSVGGASLTIRTNTHDGKQTYLLNKQVISIGRDSSNDIVMNERVISGAHLQIVREGNRFVLVHPHPSRQKTLNGLLYQGQHISGGESFRKPLTHGDLFRIGNEYGTLVTFTFSDGSGSPQEPLPEIRPIPLDSPIITIGRLPENSVVLNHPQVSGYHARLEQINGGHRLLDLGSTNHVYVNGQRITHQLLKAGDEIRIGPFKFIYTGTQLTQYDESSSIRIEAHHLKRLGNNRAVLINDISLAIPPRKFVAIVGGSGAGKSTLMNALNGQQPAQEGTVYYNGQDYYRSLAAFSTQLGYVPQDDIMHRDLSVERALYYAAKLRLPEDFTEAQINQRINEVLEDVEMKHRRKLLVSKLSGGQRKRISIALELLANPSVFFLDEPTSGLDPGLDRKMMFLLRKLADKGHTIVLVTHATHNINTCDFICFLAQGGRLVYFGPPNEARTYFDTDDFAEIYSSLEPTEDNPNVPAEAETRFKASPLYQKYIVEALTQGTQNGVSPLVGVRPAGLRSSAHEQQPMRASTSVKRGNPLRQFLLLSMRYIELIKNDVGYLLILLLQAPLIALILLLIVKFLLGSATFNWTTVAICPTRADVTSTSGPVVSNDCKRVVDFLNSPAGTAFAAQQGKSKDQLLQDAILPGSGANAQEVLFIMAFAAVMFGCTNAAREIVKEAPIYRREHAVKLGIAPYLFSKMAILGVLCLLQSAVLVVMVNVAAPLRQGIFLPANLEVYITLALTSLAGLMLGLMLSAVAPNTDRALSFLPLLLIPQVIFSGVIFSLDQPVMEFLGAFFPARWAMAGLGSSVGLHGDKLGTDSFSYQGTLFVSADPTKAQGPALAHLLLVWGVLMVMIVLSGFLTGYFLKRKEVRAS